MVAVDVEKRRRMGIVSAFWIPWLWVRLAGLGLLDGLNLMYAIWTENISYQT